ncbi:MAG: hypothetical protein DME78_03455 [Verrucomicrobia bacterium]|nr:MAG: hypothetical protein DME78_03455 [Verrucomicrobiota bacterium]
MVARRCEAFRSYLAMSSPIFTLSLRSFSRSAPRPASAQKDSIIFAAMRFAGPISFAPVFRKIRRVPLIPGAVNRTCQSFRPGRGGFR